MPALKEFQLQAGGIGFHLQDDLKSWEKEKVPPRVAEDSKATGFLTIEGVRCVVFITPSGDQWAQESVNVPPEEMEVIEPDQVDEPAKKEMKPSESDSDEDSDSEDEDTEDIEDIKPLEGKSGGPRTSSDIRRIATRLYRPRINFVFKR